MPQLHRTRRVWVYLPPSYTTSHRRYPVLYLQDGQNIFDEATSFSGEWGVDEALNQEKRATIVVAIDNGGDKRLDEYSPWRNSQYGGGEGREYAAFLTETLKPYIDQHYRTRPGRRHTGIGGSSMGALIALYATLRYPDVYGRVGVFSPALWFAKDSLDRFVQRARSGRPTRLYLVAGQQESETMVPYMTQLRDQLHQAGVRSANLRFVVRPDGQHNEGFWRREFPAAYQWLFFGKSAETKKILAP
ncbi:alpha/beta hydrolase-fold protein [Hymenobacter aerilatus]|uniref:Alpha/beta hydrolase-fold protein n=1 Tax=Hymenobacter aerilatus TaxID=2932251 RepID=A0A8T9SN85_9BACT|nr:alpha/beta hydrolase-fold protein [Hymenobacter aerilatus]UOR03502.1 alpha/beta hydrolase-fold protein [Hymenobacter aerilatus]